MEFVLINKDEPADVQCYYTDNIIKTESAANLATAGKTYMLRLGNILSDKSFNNSYIYTENGWRVIDVNPGGGGGGGTTYTAGDGIEISGDVISALLAENGGLEFVNGKLSVAKVTTKPFNEDTYNDFVLDEKHDAQSSDYLLCFTTMDENGDITDFDTYLESGKFKIIVGCEENPYNTSFVNIPIRDADGNVSYDIAFNESSATVKSVTVEFTDNEKHIYIEKYTGETEDYSDMIENATGIYAVSISLSNEYGLPEVTYSHEIIEDGTVKLSGAPAKQLEAGMGIEIIDGKIQSIPHYRSDEYLGAPQPYIVPSYGDLCSMGNDFSLYDGVISFNQRTLSNPIRLTSQGQTDKTLLNIFNINEGIFASNYNISVTISILDGNATEDIAELILEGCTNEVANIEIGYDRDNDFYLRVSDSDFNEIDTALYGFTPVTGSPYFVLTLQFETSDGFNEELCDMDILNDGRASYVLINRDNTFFQLQNSEGVAYDYKNGTFSFSGGGGGRNLMPASQFNIDVHQKFNDSKSQTEASIKLHGEGLPDGTWAEDRVAQWNYVISINTADTFYVSFDNDQNTIGAFENVKLYGETTFFMKKDEYGFCQYGFTTQDENDPYKKNTYINNALPAESYEVPSDLFISYDGEGYGLIYASFERGEAYIDYN